MKDLYVIKAFSESLNKEIIISVNLSLKASARMAGRYVIMPEFSYVGIECHISIVDSNHTISASDVIGTISSHGACMTDSICIHRHNAAIFEKVFYSGGIFKEFYIEK